MNKTNIKQRPKLVWENTEAQHQQVKMRMESKKHSNKGRQFIQAENNIRPSKTSKLNP